MASGRSTTPSLGQACVVLLGVYAFLTPGPFDSPAFALLTPLTLTLTRRCLLARVSGVVCGQTFVALVNLMGSSGALVISNRCLTGSCVKILA